MDTNFLPPIRTDADIRVLTLAPNQNNSSGHLDVIACEFENISIGGSVLYTAVSYVWGDDSCLRSIAINDVAVQVRNNLWQFLHQMRQESHIGYLWIDALCIDQKNLEERSSQVAIMGKIYSGAANVFVWLGAATEASEEERLLGTVSLCFLEPNGVLAVKRNRRIHQHAKDLLARLSKNVYWTRVWVTQEFILATNLELRCGPDSLQGAALIGLYEREVGSEFPEIWQLRSEEARSWNYGHNTTVPNMYKFIQLRKQWQTRTTPFPLLWHRIGLFSFLGLPTPPPGTHCADPRDRIYSLLSLADAEELSRAPLYPDYTKTATSLLTELVERDSRKVERELPPTTRDYFTVDNSGVRGLQKRALQLARLLEIEDPESASLYAVRKARSRRSFFGVRFVE